ncbi:5-dehydro-4-deoxy-D-glucuronate isomerase [Paenibacillus algorifonticola]|uniref:4-deoxy-L-threo-5-hexosulose-uronate ketol-isomerase n=1 Tax=Paenibacillus sp. BIHB 4019 TaxID=1870819 RepID=A0A1B2DKD1_9BACL|nr:MULTISPECIES: 5-dehydro-4-deoxy-D-glucuronate isomerase [unclassified Paenibacillus]ANY68141.1 5-dehydro-4-deoxy-D-glucuronate isomerase [Paenibacillus sp. BIHB 4019]KQN96104.1 5-keto-4-deoxyuronate isomerase [Paenibacillus sp. Leaf72]
MEIRHTTNPTDVKQYTTERLRQEFLIESLFEQDRLTSVYTHYDRMVVGGAFPVNEKLALEAGDTLKTEYFLERREIGFLNIGGDAVITVDGESYELSRLDVLYVGKGKRDVQLASKDKANPAKLYFCSALAHAEYPTRKMTMEEANPTHLGSLETSNERVLYKYIHGDGIQSCQLMLGVTSLKTGSVWNTMPSHVHDRRMEAYLYFDVNQDARVFHMMGEPSETRHLVVANEQAIISPPWSIHSGVGTSNYTFCWSMAGENYTFTDMDAVKMEELK